MIKIPTGVILKHWKGLFMKRRRLYFLLFLILWASMIFYFSHRPAAQSDLDAKLFIETFAEAQKEINELEGGFKFHFSPIYIVRKTAHVILYGVLTYLCFNVFYKKEEVLWRPSLYAFMFGVLYAISDEVHQLFIPGRTGLLSDVVIDTYGVILGLITTLVTYRFIPITKRRWFVKRSIEIGIALLALLPVIILSCFGYKKISAKMLWSLMTGKCFLIGPNGLIDYRYQSTYALYEDVELLFKRLFELLRRILYNNQEYKGADG